MLRMKPAHVGDRRRATQVLGQNLAERPREGGKEERTRRWLEENREGFEAFARFVEENGIFHEQDREW